MSLNKQSGNMYNFVTHTWNAIKGKCEHDCSYCYMKIWGKLKPIRLDQKELNVDLGKSNFIFVGSSTDMFANNVPKEWISKTLEHCRKYNENTYLFQTKNPERMMNFLKEFPKETIFGTTIETNRHDTKIMGKSPSPFSRATALFYIHLKGHRTMVTIEPILDFDEEELINLIKTIKPEWVNIGADSKNHNLPEPSYEKILKLVSRLEKFTKIN